MPPKPKYSKEEIIEAAFQMTREGGIDSVAARKLGKYINTSSSPIFTFFDSMDELKRAVFTRAKACYLSCLEGVFDYTPAFKEFGMRWVKFAADEPHLYRLLFLQSHEYGDPMMFFSNEFGDIYHAMIVEVQKAFDLDENDAREIFTQLVVHLNGIAAYIVNGRDDYFTPENISRSLSEACVSMVIMVKLRSGNFDLHAAEAMARSANPGIPPHQKNS